MDKDNADVHLIVHVDADIVVGADEHVYMCMYMHMYMYILM